jgi:hypothetical protein
LINTYTKGIISALRKVNNKNLFQVTAPISHGSSGGLLADVKNNPIGMIVSGYDEGQNLNFCLTLKQIFSVFLEQKIMNNDLTFNELNKVSVNDLELLIKKTNPEIKFISDLKKENNIVDYNKAILENENGFLTFDMLADKNVLLFDKDINASLKLVLFVYNKYGTDAIGEFGMFLFMISYVDGIKDLSSKLLSEIEYENADDPLINYFILMTKGFKCFKSQDYINSIKYLKQVYTIGESSGQNATRALMNFVNGEEYSPIITIGHLNTLLKYRVLVFLSHNFAESNDFENSIKYSNEYLLLKLKKIETSKETIDSLALSELEFMIVTYGYGCSKTSRLNEFKQFCVKNKGILKSFKFRKNVDGIITDFLN